AVPLVAVAFVLWTLALGLAAWRVWTRQPQPWARRALVVLVPVVLIAGMAAVAVAHHEALPRAVVLAAAADVQATPTTASAVRAVLTEGRVVPVGARRGAWVEVRLPDGTAGWATAGAIEEI
ncbi:MAG: SH3 domain-containing protein, partial [Rhodothermales bacterium]|nr:SH3 domain-containing protein [Rhodothermales bacterium]